MFERIVYAGAFLIGADLVQPNTKLERFGCRSQKIK